MPDRKDKMKAPETVLGSNFSLKHAVAPLRWQLLPNATFNFRKDITLWVSWILYAES